MSVKKIKNDTGSTKTYLGQDILAGAYYQIQAVEEISWSSHSALLTDIGSGDAVVNDGSVDITDVNDAIDFLKGNLPTKVEQVHDVNASLEAETAFTTTTEFNTISGTTESPYLLLKNPAASGKNLIVTHFNYGIDANNVRSIIRIWKNPTVTADGTALVEENTNFKTGATSSVATAFKSPTVSSNGAVLNIGIAPANNPSRGLNRFYFIPPGKAILVTIENSVSNASTFADIYWLERNE